jgi:hypothetical protein
MHCALPPDDNHGQSVEIGQQKAHFDRPNVDARFGTAERLLRVDNAIERPLSVTWLYGRFWPVAGIDAIRFSGC